MKKIFILLLLLSCGITQKNILALENSEHEGVEEEETDNSQTDETRAYYYVTGGPPGKNYLTNSIKTLSSICLSRLLDTLTLRGACRSMKNAVYEALRANYELLITGCLCGCLKSSPTALKYYLKAATSTGKAIIYLVLLDIILMKTTGNWWPTYWYPIYTPGTMSTLLQNPAPLLKFFKSAFNFIISPIIEGKIVKCIQTCLNPPQSTWKNLWGWAPWS